MIGNDQLLAMIEAARNDGITILVTMDEDAKIFEGRDLIETVQILGLKGCGPLPMPCITAAERLAPTYWSAVA